MHLRCLLRSPRMRPCVRVSACVCVCINVAGVGRVCCTPFTHPLTDLLCMQVLTCVAALDFVYSQSPLGSKAVITGLWFVS